MTSDDVQIGNATLAGIKPSVGLQFSGPSCLRLGGVEFDYSTRSKQDPARP